MATDTAFVLVSGFAGNSHTAQLLCIYAGFVIMPLSFGHINSSITLAVFAGFILGKPIGILTFSWFAVYSCIAIRPQDLSWGLLSGGSLLAGIGFMMALFITNLSLNRDMPDDTEIGVFFATALSAFSGLTLLLILTKQGKLSQEFNK